MRLERKCSCCLLPASMCNATVDRRTLDLAWIKSSKLASLPGVGFRIDWQFQAVSAMPQHSMLSLWSNPGTRQVLAGE